jgi:sugar/nucleoside kinase (ribokinase family)
MGSGKLRFAGLRFVAVGHVTNDWLAQGRFPGGSALYASLVAAKLGATVRVLTSFGSDFSGSDLLSRAGIELQASPSERTTTFEAVDRGDKRSWRVLSRASPILGPVDRADIVFACPVLAEVDPSCLKAPPGTVAAAGLQGWLRSLGADGMVEPGEPPDLGFLRGCKALFCSEEDLAHNAPRVLPILLGLAEIVVVTEGARGALLYLGKRPYRVCALPTQNAVDPTGAGDTFAASFLLALASGVSPLDAAVLGACCASIVIERPGPEGVEGLHALEERLTWYRSHLRAPAPEPRR